MPLEQLLAMYGMVIDEDKAQPPDSTADGAAKDPSGSRRSRSTKRRKLTSGAASFRHISADKHTLMWQSHMFYAHFQAMHAAHS